MLKKRDFIKRYKPVIFALIIGVVFYFLAQIGFNEVQSRLVGVIAFLVTLWTNSGLHMGVVSLLPILIFPILGLVESEDVVSNYSKTTIFLFIGGFLLAIATEKTGLHKRLASKLLSIFPNTPRGVLLSLIITSALLSSVLSNTTTALLLIPIASFLTTNNDLRFRLILAVAYGASVGGILTPIGTPPNLILIDFLESNGNDAIPFVKWIVMMIPLVFVMIIITGETLLYGLKKDNFKLIQMKTQTIPLTLDHKKLIYILCVLALILVANPILKNLFNILINEKLTLLAFGLFLFLPKVDLLDWKEDFAKIPFEIIFLFGAGFSIAMAFKKTGLASEIANVLVSFNYLPALILVLIISVVVVFATELTSNTALTAIMIPIIFSFAISSGLNENILMLLVAINASYAFMLPIATPPNAIAMSTGDVKISQMIQRGIYLNIFGIIVTYIVALTYWKLFI